MRKRRQTKQNWIPQTKCLDFLPRFFAANSLASPACLDGPACPDGVADPSRSPTLHSWKMQDSIRLRWYVRCTRARSAVSSAHGAGSSSLRALERPTRADRPTATQRATQSRTNLLLHLVPSPSRLQVGFIPAYIVRSPRRSRMPSTPARWVGSMCTAARRAV